MRSLLVPISASAFALGFTVSEPAARAEEGPSAYRLPPAGPLPSPASPLREPQEYARREVELAAAGSIAAIGCGGAAPRTLSTPDPCATLGASWAVDLHALYRAAPHWAIGAWATTNHFSWSAARGLGEGASGQGASWNTIALEARGYLFEDGAFDPYVAASVGGGFLSMSAQRAGNDETLRRQGISAGAGVGVTWWLSTRLRIGPQATFLWQPGGGIEHCAGGSCLDATSDVARVPSRMLRAGVEITLGLGDEL